MMKTLSLVPLLFVVLLGLNAGAATIQYSSGSTTNVEAIRGVMIDGELRDIEFFESDFTTTYGTAPPYNASDAAAIGNLITQILNGTNAQSPFFPLDLVTTSTPIATVLGQTEFHLPSFYRGFNPGTGRPDISSASGILGTNGFSQVVWGNATTSREVNVPLVFAVSVAPVPEPSSVALMGLALAGVVCRRRR